MDYIESLKTEMKEQEELASKLRKRKKLFKDLPEGVLKTGRDKGVYQYYFKKEGTERYEYVPSSKRDMVRALAQRDYEKKLLKNLDENMRITGKFIKGYQKNLVKNGYDKLSEGRKRIVNPVFIPDFIYIEEWYSKHPGNMNTYPEKGKFLTERGETVRSKSEKILADLFKKYEIPYQYEPELILQGNKKVYPDFILLDIRNRKTYIWEHLGLVENEEYASNNLNKIYNYEKSGYYLGIDIIITEESEETPLDLQLVKKKLDMYFR